MIRNKMKQKKLIKRDGGRAHVRQEGLSEGILELKHE